MEVTDPAPSLIKKTKLRLNDRGMDIVIDFDGTVVTHEFPKIGRDIGAVPVLKELVANGHRLILFTMRSDIPAANGIIDGLTVASKENGSCVSVRWGF